MSLLKERKSILKPVTPYQFSDNQQDVKLQVLEYYRCLDTLEGIEHDEPEDDRETNGYGDGYDDGRNLSEDEDEISDLDDSEADLYSEDKQKELSFTQPLLIKVFGILESGHSITINVQTFKPFFFTLKSPTTGKRHRWNNLLHSSVQSSTIATKNS